MSHEAAIYTMINVSSVTTILTGGLYKYTDTDGIGIGRDTTPAAYDTATGKLKPCGMVKGRDVTDFPGGMPDEYAQYSDTTQIVEIYLYDYRATPYETNLKPARNAIYKLLANQQLPDYSPVLWAGNDVYTRDDTLNMAKLLLIHFQVISSMEADDL